MWALPDRHSNSTPDAALAGASAWALRVIIAGIASRTTEAVSIMPRKEELAAGTGATDGPGAPAGMVTLVAGLFNGLLRRL